MATPAEVDILSKMAYKLALKRNPLGVCLLALCVNTYMVHKEYRHTLGVHHRVQLIADLIGSVQQ